MSYSFAVVDDDALLRELVSLSLSQAFGDCRIEEFQDGVEALEHIPAGRFDVVIVDSRMRRMDGNQLVSALRAKRADVPVIMISNAPEFEAGGRAAGITQFLYKADLNHLPQLVRKCLGGTTGH